MGDTSLLVTVTVVFFKAHVLDPTKLKVCFLAGTLGPGGAERQLTYMLRALQRVGVQLRVLCLTRGEFFEAEISRLGIPVTYVGRSRWRPVRLYQIVRALQREPADILQSVHFYTNMYVGAAARLTGALGIGAIRNDLFSELKANGIAGSGHLRWPSHLIANSALARNRAIDRGIPSYRVDFLSNVVDTEALGLLRNANGNDELRILFVGRLVEQKRPDLFLKVVAKVIGRLPGRQIKASIVGDGRMRTLLVNNASSLGLGPHNLEFVGNCSDIAAVYRKADVLVLTSEWEGTPNVLLEAMACGLPVVATEVGGVPEIIKGDRGILIKPNDEEGLVTATLRLIEDQKLRQMMGKCGHDYVSASHSLNTLPARLVGTYQKILHNEF